MIFCIIGTHDSCSSCFFAYIQDFYIFSWFFFLVERQQLEYTCSYLMRNGDNVGLMGQTFLHQRWKGTNALGRDAGQRGDDCNTHLIVFFLYLIALKSIYQVDVLRFATCLKFGCFITLFSLYLFFHSVILKMTMMYTSALFIFLYILGLSCFHFLFVFYPSSSLRC